jgi:signal transduction histidine kinase
VDLSALTREILERFADASRAAGCTFALHADPEIMGLWDQARLDQVLTNLIGNAIKYGPGQPILIDVASDGTSATVSVTDRGIGIGEDDLARIFDRFERAVSPRHYGGLGLGLWIAREIVQAHGGRISVQSRRGQGSCFTAVLPLGEEQASA